MLRTISFCLFLVTWQVVSIPVLGQSGTRPQDNLRVQANGSSRLIAEPASQYENPYLPPESRGIRFPVAIEGFCIVSLRDQQQWQAGLEKFQIVFDGQIYWFSSPQQRTKFAANPGRYVPALRGDCVVSYAESEQSLVGKPQHGLIHDGRLFFFNDLEKLERFRANPLQFSKVDLGNDGNCLVSKVDARQKLPGMPETLVIVNGKRYFFAGMQQQAKFLVNMPRYGVLPANPIVEEEKTLADANVSRSEEDAGADQAKPLPKEGSTMDYPKAMQGYCPVSIRKSGEWINGNPEITANFDGKRYQFAGVEEQEMFVENPHNYVPALGGDCPVTKIQTSRRSEGSVFHPTIYQGRLFLFAGGDEKQVFRTDPELYANADLAADGKCIVTSKEENRVLAGLPELLVWHKGMRYYFATPENQAKFQEDPMYFIKL